MIKRLRSFFAVFLATLLLVPTNLSMLSADPLGMVPLNSNESVLPSEEILNEFGENKFVPLIIELEEQVDTSRVVNQIMEKNKLNHNITPYEEKMEIRHAVVNELKTTAERSQKNLVQFLEQNNDVRDLREFFIMNVVSLSTTKEMYEKLLDFPGVKDIRLDREIKIDFPEVSDDGLDNDDSIEWNLHQINVPQVWEEYGIDGSGVTVGIIDSGVHWRHEALMENWRGYDPNNPEHPDPVGNWFDAVEGRSLPYDMAENPHGTHVLGTILGKDPNGENIIGVAPGAQWIAAKAFTLQGGQNSWLLAAGEFMIAPNGNPDLAPDIINNSWGGARGLDEWYRPMVQAWRDAQIVPIFAAGNTTGGSATHSVSVPANYPESIAVGATDINNIRGNFSNQGPGPYGANLKPDISAPGVNIRSSIPGGYAGGWNGTSMAAPHVAGVAALLRSVDATISVDHIQETLINTATPLTDSQYNTSPNNGYGYGLVNAHEAVSTVTDGTGRITGVVLKEGEDHDRPIIQHEPVTFSYQGLDFEINANVSDEVSVTDVKLFVRENRESNWQTIKMNRVSGDFRDGLYEAQVPFEFVTVPGFEYKIEAIDFSGNTTQTDIVSVEISFGINPVTSFDYNFSEEIPGVIYTGDWEIGEPIVGPMPLNGDKLLATSLSGNYSSNSSSVFQLPPLDLRYVDEANLVLEHWFDIEYLYDSGKILITDDIQSGEWEELLEISGREQEWNETEIDLIDYVGSEQQVFLQFVFESDAIRNHLGWYIDSISINGDGKTTDVLSTDSVVNDSQTNLNDITGLPLEATVTVLETGRTIRTDLQDGSFEFIHQAVPEGETYTLRVDSYGYYSEDRLFTLSADETIVENFLLEAIPKSELHVQVIDSLTKEPITGASINVVEDHHLDEKITDESGEIRFTEVLIGDYTVEISKENYYKQSVNIEVNENKPTTIKVELDRFPGEVIAYDNGTADNARVFIESGLGFAVRMSPDKQTNVVGASIYIWEDNFPIPGGNEFEIAVYDSDENGDPHERVIEPFLVEAQRGEWNYIDLSEYGFNTNRDFFIVMYQTADGDYSPALGFDETSDSSNRSYIVEPNGDFDRMPTTYGNAMIRSHVNHEIDPPLLIDFDDEYINEELILVNGTINQSGIVHIYNNNERVVSSEENKGNFQLEVPLTEGENKLTATLETHQGIETEHSNEIRIIRDTVAPVITNFNPDVDIYITPETEVNLSFVSDTSGGQANLIIKNELEETIEEISMEEDEPYRYTARWKNVDETFHYVTFHVEHMDQAGNKTEETAVGKGYYIEDKVTRIAGDRRQDTAIEVSQLGWLNSEYVILARSDDFADALSGTTLSYQLDAPILLTRSHQLYEPTLNEIKRLNAEKVIILGGDVAISDDVYEELIRSGLEVERIAGSNRVETSVKIAERLGTSFEKAIVVNGYDFPDALSSATYAAKNGLPILLTLQDRLSGGTGKAIETMGIQETLVVGGTIAVSEATLNELPNPKRIYGDDRYKTNIEMIKHNESDVQHLYVVTGREFADALTGASLAAKRDSNILLTYERIPNHMEDFIIKSSYSSLTLIGGKVAIPYDVETALRQLIN